MDTRGFRQCGASTELEVLRASGWVGMHMWVAGSAQTARIGWDYHGIAKPGVDRKKTGVCSGNPVADRGHRCWPGPWLGTESREASQMRGGIGITSEQKEGGRGIETGRRWQVGSHEHSAARWVREEKRFSTPWASLCSVLDSLAS